MDKAAVQDRSSKPRRAPDLLMSPEIESEIENWHITGVPPFPELMHCLRSGWLGLSRTDLRLIHHITGLSIDLHRRGFSNCTVWAQKMSKYAFYILFFFFFTRVYLTLQFSQHRFVKPFRYGLDFGSVCRTSRLDDSESRYQATGVSPSRNRD